MEENGRKQKWIMWAWVLAVAVAAIFFASYRDSQQVEQLSYSEFLQQLEAKNINEVFIQQDVIRGELIKPAAEGRKRFIVTRVDGRIAELLAKHNVKFSGVTESSLLRDILGWVIPVVLFAGFWVFFSRRLSEQGGGGLGGGFMSFGKSNAKVYVEKDIGVTFDDVAGVDEAKEELKEVVGFLRDPVSYGRLGARVPHGILLVGPPGTGKTLLAKAVAGEAGVPFFSINGSEFVEMFVGVGAARVRDLFEQARKHAPAIIFIDEVDALGKARGSFKLGGHDEKEQTLNQLLAELDGFDSASGLVLLAATNRPEILDPALLRAGRFDRQILVDRPDKAGRIQVLNVHLKKVKLAPELDREQIAALTPGFSGADLANLVNEAAMLATRKGRAEVTLDDFTGAIERIVAGLEKKNRLINPMEREVVAYHEMGHAIVGVTLQEGETVHKVSIIPRGIGALGYTISRPTEDRYLMTQEELERKMAVLLGGRAAEQLIFKRVTTGAADDLMRVTEIARSMVTRYGMSKKLGQLAYENSGYGFLGPNGDAPPEFRSYSEETAKEIDQAVREIVDSAFQRAYELLEQKRAALEKGAKLLLEKETLLEADVLAIARE